MAYQISKLDKIRNAFQAAYVTTDLRRARQVMAKNYGIEHWLEIDSGEFVLNDGHIMHVKVLLAYVGAFQFEIIEPVAGDLQLYWDFLPSDGSFAIRFHHICLACNTRADFDERLAQARQEGSRILLNGEFAGGSGFFYVDETATVGHYLEYAYSEPAFLENIPRN